MSDVVDYYRQQAISNSTTDLAWLAQLKEQALERLLEVGFPEKRDENWKYTKMAAWEKTRFSDCPSTTELPVDQSIERLSTPSVISILNGEVEQHEQAFSLPEGVVCLSLQQAMQQCPDLIQPHLDQIIEQEHGFHYLNSAYLKQGVFLYVPANVHIETPILLQHQHASMGKNIQLRHVIVLEENSQASVVEVYQGAENVDYFVNTISEIYLAKSAELTHYKVQRESRTAHHVGHTAVQQMAGSHYENHSFSLGGAIVRSDLTINLDQQNAACLMNGIYAPQSGQHVDHHTTVYHHVPNCTSQQDYKGIISENGRGVFNGRVVVSEGADKTDAQQQNKNLLLSPQAEIDTKPQLEIFADDVVCSHGATVGQLDEEALFYLASRGINQEQARNYLIQAFTYDNLAMIVNESVRSWLSRLLHQHIR